MLDNAVLGSLEYSVSVLHVPLIVVLGQDNCGAVTATKEALKTGEMPQRFIRDLVERITPSVLTSLRDGKTEINDMVVDHAKLTAERLLESSPVIAAAVHDSSTAVIGVAYWLDEGRAQLVTESVLLWATAARWESSPRRYRPRWLLTVPNREPTRRTLP